MVSCRIQLRFRSKHAADIQPTQDADDTRSSSYRESGAQLGYQVDVDTDTRRLMCRNEEVRM